MAFLSPRDEGIQGPAAIEPHGIIGAIRVQCPTRVSEPAAITWMVGSVFWLPECRRPADIPVLIQVDPLAERRAGPFHAISCFWIRSVWLRLHQGTLQYGGSSLPYSSESFKSSRNPATISRGPPAWRDKCAEASILAGRRATTLPHDMIRDVCSSSLPQPQFYETLRTFATSEAI